MGSLRRLRQFLIVNFLFSRLGGFRAGGGAGDGEGDGGDGSKGKGEGTPSGEADDVVYPADMDVTYKGNPTVLKFYDKEKKSFKVGEMIKAHLNAVSMIGKDKIVLPDANSSPEQWNEIFKKLGLPETVDKYEVKNNLSEGLKENAELIKGFKEVAHKSGILPRQSQAVLDFFNNATAAAMKSQAQMAQDLVKQNIDSLKAEYGAAYNRKMEVADKGLAAFADTAMIDSLTKKGLLNDPELTKLFVKIGEALGEDKFNDDVKNKGDMTPEELDVELKGYFEKGHPFSTPGHPKYNYYQDRYLLLQEKKLASSGRKNEVIHSPH